MKKTNMFLLLAVTTILATCQVDAKVADSELCRAQCAGTGEQEPCVFKFKIDIYASSTGYYRVEGCDGVQPTLGMVEGVKYTFDQTDVTNWFHPLGFAYGPDGVYLEQDELEKSVADPNGDVSNCTDSLSCQHAQYKLNGENLCDNDPCDPEDFGLDQYEGVYFSGGRDDWIDQGNFTVDVTITDPGTTEIFYFCHIHRKMSARIKILDPVTGTQKNPEDLTAIPYEYEVVDNEFDESCGTFNASQYEDTSKECPDMTFICDENPTQYEKCLAAINCGMHVEMRTSGDTDPTVAFVHQMIAHHRNAVQMSKALLKEAPPSLKCGTSYDGRRMLSDDDFHEFCRDTDTSGGEPLVTMLWEIINTQNAQITLMESWLEDNEQPSHDYCEHKSDRAALIGGILGGALLLCLMTVLGACYWVRSREKERLTPTTKAEKKDVAKVTNEKEQAAMQEA